MSNVEKYGTSGRVTDDNQNVAHALCILDNYDYKDTLRICNIDCFHTATMVMRTRLHITLCVYCLSCLNVTAGGTR
jgi:hypothetical protein